jgi:DNA-binding beta-propeller fold protein YncE
MNRPRRIARAAPVLLIVGLAILGSGCSSSSGGGSAGGSAAAYAGRIVFPAPPAAAVIEWVGSFRARSDVVGRGASLKKALVGEEDDEPTLAAPTTVAIGSDNTLYVVDQQLRSVVLINAAGRRFEPFMGSGPGGLVRPVGVAVAADGTLYVSDATARAVFVYGPDLSFKTAIGGREIFVRPTAIAVSDDGTRLAVCDTDAHKVYVIDTGDGTVVWTAGGEEHGIEAGEFNFPAAVAFDQQGYLYVSDYLNFRIQVFDAAGDLDLVFGQAGDRPGDLNRPRGLVADSENGIVYEVDGAFQVVQMFNLDGELLMWFGQPGSAPGQFSLPSGIARRGDLIAVADTLNRRVQLFRFLGAP